MLRATYLLVKAGMAGTPATKRIMRLVVFLLGTVGVVFLVLLLARQAPNREGFQTADQCSQFRVACQPQTIGGQTVYMCGDSNAAMNLLTCDGTLMQTMGLDSEYRAQLGIRDAVCYMVGAGASSKIGSNYYVCYQRPPRIAYDDAIGMNEYINPGYAFEEDPNPEILKQDLETACGTFQGISTIITRSLGTTRTNISSVGNALSSIAGAYSTVNALRARCTGTLTPDQQTACTALSNFGVLANDANFNALTTLNTTLATANSNMGGLFMGNVVPSFKGLNCKAA